MDKRMWTRDNLARPAALHPLLVIAVFVVVFLAIHPFQDGNGRLSHPDHSAAVAGRVRILEIARDRGRVTIRAAAGATGASRNTIKDHVHALTRAGRLTRRGAGRGTWYALS